MALNEEHLIDAVREHRCLWNITTKAYKDQRARENSWSNISRELGFPADVCAKRWKSLRHTFVRELEKTNKRKTGSKGPPPRSALSRICEPNDALCWRVRAGQGRVVYCEPSFTLKYEVRYAYQVKVRKQSEKIHTMPSFTCIWAFSCLLWRSWPKSTSKYLQAENLTAYQSCCKILALKTKLCYTQLQKLLRRHYDLRQGKILHDDSIQHCLISSSKLESITQSMYCHLQKTVDSLSDRSSDISFFVENCDILDPARRNALKGDVRAVLSKINTRQSMKTN